MSATVLPNQGASPSRQRVNSSPNLLTNGGSSTGLANSRRRFNGEDFYDRQWNEKCQVRRDVALITKSMAEARKMDEDIMQQGAHGLEGFRKFLTERFGTVACGWRVGLDLDGRGKLTNGDIRQRCHHLGFGGNMKQLWIELDPDNLGYTTLKVIDPNAHDLLQAFQDFLLQNYESTLDAWRSAINPTRVPTVTYQNFVERCEAMGFFGDAKRLFKLLRTDMARKELMFKDVDPVSDAAMTRGDPCAESLAAGNGRALPKAALSPLAASRMAKLDWNDSFARTATASTPCSPPGSPKRQQRPGTKGGESAARTSTTAGESNPLDLTSGSGSGLASLGDLSSSPMASPSHTDPRPGTAQTVVGLGSSSGSSLGLGLGALGLDNNTDLPPPAGTATFMLLQAENSRSGSPLGGSSGLVGLSGSASQPLLGSSASTASPSGKAPRPWLSKAALSVKEQASPPVAASPMSMMSVSMTQGSCTPSAGALSPTRNSAWLRETSCAQLLELSAMKDQHVMQDYGMRSPDGVLFELKRRCGSVVAGWQLLLDPTGAGYVSFMDFSTRLRGMGFLGSCAAAWEDLKAPEAEVLTLADLDPHGASMLNNFRKVFSEKYGNMLKAWEIAFDPKGLGVVDAATFEAQCRALQCPFEAAELFELLRDKTLNMPTLTLREIDIRAYRAQQRGDREMITEAQDTTPPQDLDFHERQESSLSYKWRRTQSKVIKEDQAMTRRMSQLQDFRSQSLLALLQLLTRKFGSCATAWRVALDPHQQGQLSKVEFVKVVRDKVGGFRGDLSSLWAELAKPGAAYVTLHDLDPQAADELWSFREFLLEKCGSLVEAWQYLDPKKTGQLKEPEFLARVRSLQYPGETSRLFSLLRAAPHRDFLTMSDLALGAAQAYYRGDDQAVTMKKRKAMGPAASSPANSASRSRGLDVSNLNMSLASSDGEVSQSSLSRRNVNVARATPTSRWRQELGRRQRVAARMKEDLELEQSCEVRDVADFRRTLKHRFRSSFAAWRCVLDHSGNNRLSFGGFCLAIERLGGLKGKMKSLWLWLDSQNKGYVEFRDLDAEADAELSAFRKALCEAFGSIEDFWERSLSLDRSDLQWFQECCSMAMDPSWTAPKLKQIFDMLVPEPSAGRHTLLLEDLQALTLNLSAEEKLQLSVSSSSLASLQRGTPSLQELAAQSVLLDRVPLLQRPLPKGPRPTGTNELPKHSAADFCRLLALKYGSLYAAWVQFLDVTELGRVPKGEFVQRAQSIGASGNVHQLFASIDQEGKGYITLRDLNPEVAACVSEFLNCCTTRFGTLRRSWKSFDEKKLGYLGKDQFLALCHEIAYTGDAGKLFKMLRPAKERQVLYLEDLGPQGVAEVRRARTQNPKNPPRNHSKPGSHTRAPPANTAQEQSQ